MRSATIVGIAICLTVGLRSGAAQQKEKWQPLFDGRTLKGWHALGFSSIPSGLWTVENGKAASFQQYTDTLQFARAMEP